MYTLSQSLSKDVKSPKHKTPLDLIHFFKFFLKEELNIKTNKPYKTIQKYKRLYEECKDWVPDETEIVPFYE